MQVVLSPSDSPICYTLQIVASVVVEISLVTRRSHELERKGLPGRHGDLLWIPNNGNAPANELRAKEFAESALAAYRGYASTRKVKTPEKTSMVLFVCGQYPDIVEKGLKLTRSRRSRRQ